VRARRYAARAAISAGKKAALHLEDLCWASIAGFLDAVRRRTADEAAESEPLAPGASRRFAELLSGVVSLQAAGPLALVGGELAACTLLSGPPCRGPPVPSSAERAREGWRPLDVYVGRNSRHGDVKWGSPHKVGRDGDAVRCCRRYEEGLRRDAVRWHKLGELRGRRLRCHCPPDSPCHTNSLIVLFCEMTGGAALPLNDESAGASRVITPMVHKSMLGPTASPPVQAALPLNDGSAGVSRAGASSESLALPLNYESAGVSRYYNININNNMIVHINNTNININIMSCPPKRSARYRQ